MIDAEALAALREKLKLTQGGLARKANISRAQIGRWESGKRGADPGFSVVCRLAEALEVPPWEFMSDPERVKHQLKIWPGGRPKSWRASAEGERDAVRTGSADAGQPASEATATSSATSSSTTGDDVDGRDEAPA